MRKRTLILRDPMIKLRMHEEYLEIISPTNSYSVAFIHIERIYLNKSLDIPIGVCYALSQKVDLILIDHDGYLLATITEINNAQI